MTNLQIKGGLPESLIYIKEKPMKKIKSGAKKLGMGVKLIGSLTKEIGKRTVSQSYTHKKVFGKNFGKKNR